MALKPVADRVIVKYFETEDKTASGIVLPDSSKEKTQQAEFIAVGGGKVVDGRSTGTGKAGRPCDLRKIHRNRDQI